MNAEDRKKIARALRQAADTLTIAEKKVLMLYLGIDSEITMTAIEIAYIFRVEASHIEELIESALQRLPNDVRMLMISSMAVKERPEGN
ncbi:MAG: hypothetical protein AABZ39_00210 [Spirochaetota bacterium]